MGADTQGMGQRSVTGQVDEVSGHVFMKTTRLNQCLQERIFCKHLLLKSVVALEQGIAAGHDLGSFLAASWNQISDASMNEMPLDSASSGMPAARTAALKTRSQNAFGLKGVRNT
ncbi:hypothetical protein XHV734_1983 [Xanthomonas hortorum pv. vitians]|nr:hypothetical protein XHV734_1983 [Xanthomonas hortorum pv. vitians]